MHLQTLGARHVRLTDRVLLRWVLLLLASGLFGAALALGRCQGVAGFVPTMVGLAVLLAVGIGIALLRWATIEITPDVVRMRAWRLQRFRTEPRDRIVAVELAAAPVAGAALSRHAQRRLARPLVLEVRLITTGDGMPAVIPLWRSHRLARVCAFAGELSAASGLPWRDGRLPCIPRGSRRGGVSP